jgi:hypothetical protein
LVEALWRHHAVRRTVVVTFDYTAIALLELLRRQLEPTTSHDTRPAIAATLMVNGGLFADAHTHPWQNAAAAHQAGSTRDVVGSALAARVHRVDALGTPVLTELPPGPGRARRAAAGDHPARRSGVPA